MGPRRRLLLRSSILLLCVALVAWMIWRLGPSRLLATARAADPVWLALSLIPIAARFLVWSLKWNLMLRRETPVPFTRTVELVLAGAFVNLTTPTAKLGGGLLRAALLRRRAGWTTPAAFGWTLADQVTNGLGNLALIGGLALGTTFAIPAGAAARAFLVSGLVATGMLIAALALRGVAWRWVHRPGVARQLARLTPSRFRNQAPGERGDAWVEPAFGPLLTAPMRHVLLDVGLAACSFASLCVANAMVLRGLGVEFSWLAASASVALSYLAGTLVGTMGGIGATEAALIELSTLGGLPGAAATAGALLHRGGLYLVTAVCGGAALWRAGRRRGGEASG